MRTIKWVDNKVVLIDQNALPLELKEITLSSYQEVAEAIKEMKVRGAPAIGVAAAMGLALAAINSKATTVKALLEDIKQASQVLRSTRPTAINLFWAIERILDVASKGQSVTEIKKIILDEAKKMADEDIEVNRNIGKHGHIVISDGDTVLTHCNAGSLATVGYGTALGVIRAAVENGKRVRVLADETRPKLQGARLTAFELHYDNIPVTVITDNMAGYFMSQKKINLVIVGADRVLTTGHVINKIGTYSVAVLANYHGIPFYVAAPLSTFDLKHKLHEIKIEERDSREVTHIGNVQIVPENVPVLNPAFDITPPNLITGIITEKGIIYNPNQEKITMFLKKLGLFP